MDLNPQDAAALWNEFHGELYRFVKRRVGAEPLVDDILQQAFLRAHAQLASGTELEQPRAWLYQIVRNLVKDATRSQGSQRALVSAVEHEPAVEMDVSSEMDTFALVARLLPLFVERLDAPYKEALRLTELEGLTHAEAAKREGVSLTCMKTRVRRARQQVSDALQRCCTFELDARGRMISCSPRSSDASCKSCGPTGL